ncbi:transketolase-like TK C-terminal-containing protein [Komagataeibacter swingsii]|uniref:Transketolase n=1 Tax=Komagataeibacter swingsii TaxID=215220 RepID=A0A2V4R5K3_9PROT|nr:transketolase C-terminal domain-containing protein [Komagataeibacter swingsii]PYD70043.1 transketolase [Komagataeibacter swingsii]GBQ56524.1 transketolase [Komagataeibacter swingsii DSM 16373]
MPEDLASTPLPTAYPAAPSMPQRLATAIRHAISTHEPDRRYAPHAQVMADFCAVLWSRFLRFDPASPEWPDRDRLVVSSPRYHVLPRIMAELSGQAPLPPHADDPASPRHDRQACGPSGQGLGTAIGMALAEQVLAARFGRSLVNHRIWGLGCWTELSTGVALESAALAGQMGLDRVTLVVGLWLSEREAVDAILPRYSASGWSVRKVNAASSEQIAAAITSSQRTHKPCLIACIAAPETDPPPFVDDPGLWAGAARRGASARRSWLRRLLKDRQKAEFERMARNQRPAFWQPDWQRSWREQGSAIARVSPTFAAQRGLETLHELLPELICLRSRRGMLADLPATRRSGSEMDLSCGTQVHGMAALLNGIAMHDGLLAFGTSTIIAVDRMRPALRYAAMTDRQVIYLLTDDDLLRGDGAGGGQPVEQLASLRAMPNVAVFRPADHRETMECMELALRRTSGPSLLTLESAPALATSAAPEREQHGLTNLCARGGYVLAEAEGARQVTLIATGHEVILALAARKLLRDAGVAAAVVSLPCWELFAVQKMTYRAAVLGTAPRIGIEAASGFGWERWLGTDGLFVGIDGFGASYAPDRPDSPAGITPERICHDALRLVRPHADALVETAGGNGAPPGMASVDASV